MAAAAVVVPIFALGLIGCSSEADTATAPVTPTNVTPGNEEFCAALATFDNSASELLDDDPTNDAETQAFLTELGEFNTSTADTMPAEIKPAFQSLEQDLQALSDDDSTSVRAAVGNATEVIKSLRTISDWTETNCGFEF